VPNNLSGLSYGASEGVVAGVAEKIENYFE
jgi:hypothetical protein